MGASAVEQLDAQPREAEGTALERSGGDTEATDSRERWRFTSACSGELYRPVFQASASGLDSSGSEESVEPSVDDDAKEGEPVETQSRELWDSRQSRRR